MSTEQEPISTDHNAKRWEHIEKAGFAGTFFLVSLAIPHPVTLVYLAEFCRQTLLSVKHNIQLDIERHPEQYKDFPWFK